jgi:hypothetical protein
LPKVTLTWPTIIQIRLLGILYCHENSEFHCSPVHINRIWSVNKHYHFATESLITKCAKMWYRPSPAQYANLLHEIWTWCILRNILIACYTEFCLYLLGNLLSCLFYWIFWNFESMDTCTQFVRTIFCFMFRTSDNTGKSCIQVCMYRTEPSYQVACISLNFVLWYLICCEDGMHVFG